jgi:hypothetical protein
MYDRCGSRPDLNGKFYENNIVIQYDQDLIEVWDEAKRLRCEWYNDYEKGVTKPPIRVSDLEVVELNFRGEPSIKNFVMNRKTVLMNLETPIRTSSILLICIQFPEKSFQALQFQAGLNH